MGGLPSAQNIDAIQDSEVLMVEQAAREKMLEAIPKMERFFRLLLEGKYIATQQRINDSLTSSAEERDLTFIKRIPHWSDRYPSKT